MKNCHVDKFGSNDDLDTFICEDINGTFTACGGDVTSWKQKKILVFHRQPYYRYYYYISRMLPYQKKRKDCGFFFFFSIWSFASNFVCFREIFSGFDIDESYNYIQRVI